MSLRAVEIPNLKSADVKIQKALKKIEFPLEIILSLKTKECLHIMLGFQAEVQNDKELFKITNVWRFIEGI